MKMLLSVKYFQNNVQSVLATLSVNGLNLHLHRLIMIAGTSDLNECDVKGTGREKGIHF